MIGLPLRPLGVALLKSWRPTPEDVGGAVLLKSWRSTPEDLGVALLKSWRPTPEVVGGGTTEVVEAYP